ncbi:MAG TPA: serine/threonine-protein kinase [Kofleriaceae bacterium]
MSAKERVDALGDTLGEAAAPPAAPRIRRGASIDRYVVIDLLGTGGMGQVFAAYDPELDRKVAIKLLRAGHGSTSREHQSRLMREGKAMAKLSHPNVVVVHDVGTYDGDMFVAMELVEGKTLEAWLGERPPWRDVVGAFVQAGRGLEAAHAAGIVHRDFKPANVLVRIDGRVLVTDFGLARSVSAPHADEAEVRSPNRDATQAGTLLGTPAYMSPEQLAGQPADARSDQFSFCLALYAGVYGERPFDLPTISESGEPDPTALDEARWVIPPSPRESSVPAWLRRAIVRGLALDPGARHPAMSDLIRELSRDPRRNRRIAAAIGATMVLAGAGIAWGATRETRSVCALPDVVSLDAAWNSGVKQRIRDAFVGSRRAYALDTFNRVAAEIDRRGEQWRSAWVDACEATHVRHAQSPALLDLRMQCLDRRAREIGALVELFASASDPELVDKSVRAVAALPDLRECADAERLSTRVPLPSNPVLQQRIASARSRLDTLVAQFRAGKAKALAATAVALADETATLSHPPLEAEARLWAGEVFDELGDGKSAEAQLRKGLTAAATGRDDILLARLLSALVYVIGHHHQRYAEVDALVPVAEAITLRVDDPARTAELTFFRGVIEEDRGHYAEARKFLEQALAMRIKQHGAEHPEVAAVHHNLAVVLDELGEYDHARTNSERAHAILEKLLGPEHPSVGIARLGVGGALRRAGKLTEARPHFEAALRIWQTAYGPDHPFVGMGLNNLMVLLHDMGDHEAALEVGLRALAFKEKHAGPDSAATANTLANLGRLLSDMNRDADARPHFERALAIRRKTLEPSHPDIATSLSGLAVLALADNRPADALPLVSEALAIRQKLAPDHPELLTELVVLARTNVKLGRPATAVPYLERGLALAATKAVDANAAAEAKLLLATLLWDGSRDRARAVKLVTEARDAWKQLGPRSTDALADADAWLASHKL